METESGGKVTGEQDVLFWGDKYSGVTVVMVTQQLYAKCILTQLQSILKLMRHTGKEALCCSLSEDRYNREEVSSTILPRGTSTDPQPTQELK